MRSIDGRGSDFTLHPLIHTLLEFTLAQYIVGCQGGGAEAGCTALMAIDVTAVADELGIPMRW